MKTKADKNRIDRLRFFVFCDLEFEISIKLEIENAL